MSMNLNILLISLPVWMTGIYLLAMLRKMRQLALKPVPVRVSTKG